MNHHTLTIGSRTSRLAMWQTEHIISLLQAAWPGLECRTEPFVTKGDKTLDQPLPQIGGKGLFTLELESALRDGRIHLAVHSLKDLPVENAPGLTLGAIVGRADARDVLIGLTLDDIPLDGVVGTSSLRRHAQLRRLRPDVEIRSIRGNVETRIRKVTEGQYDAAILAAAGVTRLELREHIAQYLPLAAMLPAPGQGALAVQCRADDAQTLELLAVIHNPNVAAAVTAERAFLNGLGGGCATPVAAYAEWVSVNGDRLPVIGNQPPVGNDRLPENRVLHMTGLVSALDGKRQIRVTGSGTDARTLGSELAEEALARGAREILAHV